MWNIWIDTGGTFTDCLATAPDGSIKRSKILSSGVLRGNIIEQHDPLSIKVEINWPIDTDIFEGYTFKQLNTSIISTIHKINLTKGEIHFREPVYINPSSTGFEITGHEEVPILASRLITKTRLFDPLPAIAMRLGSTKGTNALLERKGAKVVLMVTKGFKDLLKIGTQQRPELFALNIKTPAPLYHSIIEIDERIDSDGNILSPLSRAALQVHNDLLKTNNLSIAIALINSYKNNVHENLLAKTLKETGINYISVSSDLSSAIKILPRAQTTVVNAYLLPIMSTYLAGIKSKLEKGTLRIMTSAGAVVESKEFRPKDSLLSGPAGGIIGASLIGKLSGEQDLVTFDMGGTSTDVSIINKSVNFTYETKVGDAHIQSPAIDIETIAAGGGSICAFQNGMLQVGPESAGADPGPACYGNSGPLTITDVNLLAGRIAEHQFTIPIDRSKSENALNALLETANSYDQSTITKEELITSILDIANEKMAAAIKSIAAKKGTDISKLTLMSYGGAGGQHACDLAQILKISKVIAPYDAGLLSAFGIGSADIDIIKQQLVLEDFSSFKTKLPTSWESLKGLAIESLISQGFHRNDIIVKHQFLHLRLKGQESTIELDAINYPNDVETEFKKAYLALYGHWIDNLPLEVESLKLVASIPNKIAETKNTPHLKKHKPVPVKTAQSLVNGQFIGTPIFIWEQISFGTTINGPALIISENCTVYVKDSWQFELNELDNGVLTHLTENQTRLAIPVEAERTLYLNRFKSVVEQMGAVLERTSFSVNVKERLDFSCALLNAKGELVVNAPHIPVHLGSLGVCVRSVCEHLTLKKGDVFITNHPAFGGSHLPDITLISPIYIKNELIGYVANRAHHAEIGGKTPGSMPTDATNLYEEGIVIYPQLLIDGGKEKFNAIKSILMGGPYPTRSINENLADLRGAIASINSGIQNVLQMCEEFGKDAIVNNMQLLMDHSDQLLLQKLCNMEKGEFSASEQLDDGSLLHVAIDIKTNGLTFDFSGSSPVHPFNLNATEAIVNSVILYVLRLLVDENIPLNEGLMKHVNIILPTGLLKPDFNIDNPPAVVGGNTEVSQRLTDTLLKCFGMAACSQGTMNNLLFGNNKFGYYETICGGTGAGNTFNGHDAIHQHMTNTRITDPEIIELRYPVRLNRFEIRNGSGGSGKYYGGNGVIREFTFLETLTLTLLTQHRKIAPYGLNGGSNGQPGLQYLLRKSSKKEDLEGIVQTQVFKGDQLIIETPGGGGYGSAQ
ncbi:MAG TPA: hydantoinase B/oxoprolinase family protein [Fulvivirga sp.]|nr:hydantoinase B/oxoprolinase family protein [Fulvivirga sp.]